MRIVKIFQNGHRIKRVAFDRLSPGEAALSRIEVSHLPNRTEYYLGENLNLSGCSITAIYSDDSYTPNVQAEFDPADGTSLEEPGDHVINVSYSEDGVTVSTSFSITVLDIRPSLLNFTLTSTLTQNLYFTQSVSRGVTIDWGDGSELETIPWTETTDAAAGEASYSPASHASHTYASAGDYVVAVIANNGVTWCPGNGTNGLLGPYQLGMKGYSTYPTLTAFLFGEGATISERYAFAGANSLRSIVVPNDITAIPDYTFAGCSRLSNIIIPSGVTAVGKRAFYNCQVYDFTAILPQLSNIGIYAFAECINTAPDIELTSSSIGYGAFANCTQLRRMWIRDTVISMDVLTVTKTSQGVTEIDHYESPFYNCKGSLVLYAECAESDKPIGWDDHFNTYSGTNTDLIVIWNQQDTPTVSLVSTWNALGNLLTYEDETGAGIGYSYDQDTETLTIY